MRTTIIILSGFVLWAICLGVAKLMAGSGAVASASNNLPNYMPATLIFLVLWFAAAAWNMYVGTTHGYSWQEEFPIFLLIFGLPALVAVVAKWKYL